MATEREKLRALYSRVIRLLAEIVSAPQTDKQCADEVIPRDWVMARVVGIREQMDRLSAILADQPPAEGQVGAMNHELVPKEPRKDECRHDWSGMTHRPEFDYCRKCGMSRAAPPIRPADELPLHIKSGTEFLAKRLDRARCDSEAVSDCVRCSALMLARHLLGIEPPPLRMAKPKDTDHGC